MSLTKAQRRYRTKVLAEVYRTNIKLQDMEIDLNVERARDEVFRRFMSVRESLFRKSTTLADGDALPVDWVLAANRAVTSGGKKMAFINVSDIGFTSNNTWGAATSTNACYYFCNQKFNTVPAGLTGNTVYYYYQPVRLAGTSIPDSTTDNMPQELEAAIIAGAFERCLQMMLEEADALKLTQVELDNTKESLQLFYRDYFQTQTESPRTK